MLVEKDDELYFDHTNYLVCVTMNEIKAKNRLNLNLKEDNVRIGTLLNYSFWSIEDRSNISHYFKIESSFVLVESVCFFVDKNDLENVSSPFSKFSQNYEFYLYVYSNGIFPDDNEYVMRKHNSLDFFVLKIYKIKIYNQQYLESNCFTNMNQPYSNRFQCFNECYKKIESSELFLYNFNETATLNLNLIFNFSETNTRASELRQELREKNNSKFEECSKNCQQVNCFIETCHTGQVRIPYYNMFQKEFKEKINIRTTILKPYYSLAYFYLQFFSLIILFTGTSVVDITPILFSILVRKLKLTDSKYFKLIFPKFKPALILFSTAIFIFQSVVMYKDYKLQSNYPNKTVIFDFISIDLETEPISIVVCFPIETLIYNDTKIEANRNTDLLNNLTFKELELKTNFELESKINDFYMKIAEARSPFDNKISKDVLFKNCEFHNLTVLTRCLRIDIFIEPLRYKGMIPIFFLFVLFKDPYWKIYVIAQDQEFTSNLVNFRSEYYIEKFVSKNSLRSSKTNCKIYSEIEGQNCTSQRSCIDKCVNHKFLEKYSLLPVDSVINKTDFNLTELYDGNIRFTDRIKNNVSLFNFIITDIKKKCKDEFKYPDCNFVRYKESFLSDFNQDNLTSVINLDHQKFTTREVEASFGKLILDILNLESILFGLNATSILTFFFSRMRSSNLWWFKIYKFFMFTFCFTGFLVHNLCVYNEIVVTRLIENGYYEPIKNYDLPNLVFCFNYNKKRIDENHKLTGSYLDNITDDLNYENVFDNIRFFNKKIWKTASPLNNSSNQYDEVSINHFYFFWWKCFNIRLNVLFNTEDLYFLPHKTVLYVKFKEYLYNQYNNVHFLYRKSETKRLYANLKLEIGPPEDEPNKIFTYNLVFENNEINRNDKFELIKNPRSFFYKKRYLNEAETYLNNMKSDFENDYNLTTKDIILEEIKNFNKEIDDELFEQFFIQSKFIIIRINYN